MRTIYTLLLLITIIASCTHVPQGPIGVSGLIINTDTVSEIEKRFVNVAPTKEDGRYLSFGLDKDSNIVVLANIIIDDEFVCINTNGDTISRIHNVVHMMIKRNDNITYEHKYRFYKKDLMDHSVEYILFKFRDAKYYIPIKELN